MEKFVPSSIVHFLHQVPHINITFQFVNSTFNPRSELYLESLGIIASVPALVLIVTLVSLLIYLLCQCCHGKHKKRRLKVLKCVLSFISVLCCGAIGVGMYGHILTHSGAEEFDTHLKEITYIVNGLHNQTSNVVQHFTKNISPRLGILGSQFKREIDNYTVQQHLQLSVLYMQANVTEASKRLRDVDEQLGSGVILPEIYNIAFAVELYRWPATWGILGLFIFFNLILLIAVCKNSRCLFITFAIFGLLAIVMNWLMASFYLATVVGTSDMCIAPNTAVEDELSGHIPRNIINYYTECPTDTSPFLNLINDVLNSITDAQNLYSDIRPTADYYYSNSPAYRQLRPTMSSLGSFLNGTRSEVNLIGHRLDCHKVNYHYTQMVKTTCGNVLFGTVLMLCSAVGTALFLTILVYMDSHTWIHHKKKGKYLTSEETAPFLAHPYQHNGNGSMSRRSGRYHMHTPPQTPPFPGTLNGSIMRANHQHAYRGRASPPPSYDAYTLPAANFYSSPPTAPLADTSM